MFRQLAADDEPIVWRMLYEAARMAEEGITSPDAAKHNPALVKYAKNWGRPGDVGFVHSKRQTYSQLVPYGFAY